MAADQIIVGERTTTVVVGSTPQMPCTPDRPEPPRPVRVRLNRDDVVTRIFHGDAELFDYCYDRHGFPRSIGRTAKGSPLWFADEVDTWLANQRNEVRRLAPVLK